MHLCIFTAVLHLFIDGARLPGDGSARVSVTNIITGDRISGLYCVDQLRAVGTSPQAYINWYLGEQQIERRINNLWSSYLGWSSVFLFYYGYQYIALKRDPNTTVSEGIFSCRHGRGNRIYSSVSVGVYYPG